MGRVSIGGNFVNTKASPSPTDLICAADEKTGLTPASTDLSTCASYVSDHLTLKDATGNLVTATFSILVPPAVSGSTTLAFGQGIPSTQTINVVGNPTPTICLSSGSLTADFSLNGGNCGTGTFQIQFDGSLTTPTANHAITLSATNSVGTISIPVAIDVSPQLAIISSNTVSGEGGFPVNFVVVATGVPTPALSLQNLDISDLGLTFKDNGNEAATISGVPTRATQGFIIKGSGVVATNSQGLVEQDLDLKFTPAPSATQAPPSSANFIAGVANQVLLTSAGAVTPVSWNLGQNPPPPSWLSLRDNGDGTALLKGTPPLLTVGAFNISPGLTTLGAEFGLASTYTVNVQPIPLFLSPNTATFTVGSGDAFTPSNAEGAFITLVGDLPSGLTFTPGLTGTVFDFGSAGGWDRRPVHGGSNGLCRNAVYGHTNLNNQCERGATDQRSELGELLCWPSQQLRHIGDRLSAALKRAAITAEDSAELRLRCAIHSKGTAGQLAVQQPECVG